MRYTPPHAEAHARRWLLLAISILLFALVIGLPIRAHAAPDLVVDPSAGCAAASAMIALVLLASASLFVLPGSE